MKKFLVLAILSISAVAFVPSVEAKSSNAATNATAVAPQINVRIGGQNRRGRYNQSRRATRTYARDVRVGRQVYRETYRVTYRANGTTRTQLLSRVRIGRVTRY